MVETAKTVLEIEHNPERNDYALLAATGEVKYLLGWILSDSAAKKLGEVLEERMAEAFCVGHGVGYEKASKQKVQPKQRRR